MISFIHIISIIHFSIHSSIKWQKGTIGKAYPEIDVRIHNPDSDGFGDICLRGRSMMMGYLHDKEKTLETLDEDGWLHTGDLGKIDEEGINEYGFRV